MIEKQISKVKLLLMGTFVRLEENIDYFHSIEVKFQSGKQEFLLNIEFIKERFLVSYLGSTNEILKSEIINFILSELKKYDGMILNYYDRTNTVTLICNNNEVKSNIGKPIDIKSKLNVTTVGGRKYIINEKDGKQLLNVLGILTSEGKIKNDMIRKYNQIDRFLELISDIKFDNNNLTILDCACGKSYLSFVLNYYFTEIKKNKCQVYGVDYNEGVIASSIEQAKKLNYNNMKFINADLTTFNLGNEADLVVSLHACDVATDYAIFSGIKHNAKAIVSIPCCHKELANDISYEPFSKIFDHGIFKRRFCDMLTDSLRVLLLESFGYKVSVIEYVSPLDTPKNIMIKAIKQSSFNEKKRAEYFELKNQFHVNPTLERLLTMDGVF